MAADYVLKEGNEHVILCERGIRTFETATRFTLDLSAVPWLKLHSHLPVIVDPSHASGDRRLVEPLVARRRGGRRRRDHRRGPRGPRERAVRRPAGALRARLRRVRRARREAPTRRSHGRSAAPRAGRVRLLDAASPDPSAGPCGWPSSPSSSGCAARWPGVPTLASIRYVAPRSFHSIVGGAHDAAAAQRLEAPDPPAGELDPPRARTGCRRARPVNDAMKHAVAPPQPSTAPSSSPQRRSRPKPVGK